MGVALVVVDDDLAARHQPLEALRPHADLAAEPGAKAVGEHLAGLGRGPLAPQLAEQPHQRPLETQRVGRALGGGGQHLGQIEAAADTLAEPRQRFGDAPASAPRLAGQRALEGQAQQRQRGFEFRQRLRSAADDFQHGAGASAKRQGAQHPGVLNLACFERRSSQHRVAQAQTTPGAADHAQSLAQPRLSPVCPAQLGGQRGERVQKLARVLSFTELGEGREHGGNSMWQMERRMEARYAGGGAR